MALDPMLKVDILQDLDLFKRGKEFYRWIGHSWKREYLFHDPPGTGKSSLVTAIANYMKYGIIEVLMNKVEDPYEAMTEVICALDGKLKEKEPMLPSMFAQADMKDVKEEEESLKTTKNSHK
ncbi:hypothetical protein KI387_019984 [Taxus chinensis]|uniref:ATPase AAA-type core domain-containing protein n=1 Tax=Taxus chinensis TaxID=29808 RepID=A0AA38LDW7_TAXCH|nr:hypothetical protein KI387_019984 [Taxus chinensis]